ncbi:MAG TPA: CheR family methyltransferase [Oculatellaceae cyanobacterium]|jgi:chemotaxis protein methyltransferase CheR
MNDNLLQRFIQLLVSQAGWQIRQQDYISLGHKIEFRVKALKLLNAEAYYQLLSAETEQSYHEWRQLALLLTTTETYFFRDEGQFSLLRNKLIPELIEQKRKKQVLTGESKPSLRIWSAGCSTGEEPYSLAILLTQLIPDWEKWNLYIIGTDINLNALEKARHGIFTSWSFRQVNPEIQKRYFSSWKGDWKLDGKIRQMVNFEYGNLVKDSYPNTGSIYDMDLIICRNVFVYFDSNSIGIVLHKFAQSLNLTGYLITGHAELYGQGLNLLKSQVFPESVVYQRRDHVVSSPQLKDINYFASNGLNNINSPQKLDLFPSNTVKLESKQLPQFKPNYNNQINTEKTQLDVSNIEGIYKPKVVDFQAKNNSDRSTSKVNVDTIIEQVKNLVKNKNYLKAISELEKILAQHPNDFNIYYLLAKVYANLGKYPQAKKYCEQALSVDSRNIKPYYILANIAEEQGNITEAKVLLKKIIYLAPDSISAYLELASIYQQEGDITRCVKMRNVALDFLKKLPTNATVESQGDLTVGELINQLEEILNI